MKSYTFKVLFLERFSFLSNFVLNNHTLLFIEIHSFYYESSRSILSSFIHPFPSLL